VGASLYYFGVYEGLTLGAYVSLFAINMATDAVSVQSVLSRFEGIGHDIKVLIEGESLGNDATAVIAFFFIGLPWMMSGSIDAGHAVMDAGKVFVVSTLIGLALGFGFYMLMKLFSNKRGELFAFIVEAYIAYVLAEEMHVSGILTLIVAIVATKAWIDSDLAEDESKKTKSFMRKLRLGGIETTTHERLEYL
jgi:CPA1 family monovalent cation:H+ antiporter